MPLPNYYKEALDKPIASYDFFDLQEATGIKTFYGVTSDASGANTYGLAINAIDVGTGNLTASVYPTRTDISSGETLFPVTFAFPKVIRGSLNTTFTWVLRANAGTVDGSVSVKLYKNSTQIGSTKVTSIKTTASDTTTTSNLLFTDLETGFTPDDTFQIGFTGVPVGNASVFLHHDPQNRNFTATTPNVTASNFKTKLEVYIPFKIDL